MIIGYSQQSPWSIIDDCTLINKGMGVFDWERLLQQLVDMTGIDSDGQPGLMGFPRPMEDITGDYMVGVEADAVYEAIYQGLVSEQDAVVIHAGPQPGLEENYKQALRRAINAGAPTINNAVRNQNRIFEEKRNDDTFHGKESKAPQAFPEPFKEDMGHMVLDPQWEDGAWGPMNDKEPWQIDRLSGQAKIRVGNRGQENKFNESWARPYKEGLKEERERQGHTGDTSESIDASMVRPGSVYINFEAKNALYDLIDNMVRVQGYSKENGTLTPQAIKQAWLNHSVLRNHTPQGAKPIQSIHNVRNLNPGAGVAADPDAAEGAVDAQQVAPPSLASQWFTTDDFTNAQNKHLKGSFSHYKNSVLQTMADHYGVEAPPAEIIIGENGKGGYGAGYGKTQGERLKNGFVRWLQSEHPGIQSRHGGGQEALPPGMGTGPIPRPAVPAPAPAAPPPTPEPSLAPAPAPTPRPPPPSQPNIPGGSQIAPPPAPALAPAPIPVPQAPRPPPVPQRPPPQPVPVGQVPPNILPPTPSHLRNTQEVPAHPTQRIDGPPQFRQGWRGLADRLAYGTGMGLGAGAAGLGRLFGKEDIEKALEGIQKEIALQDENIVKALPATPMSISNTAHISMMAGQIQHPVSDVVTVLNSRGDWREIAKSMGMSHDYVQLLKVAFRNE
tara:strand:+ start:6892 stop:8898 length:2007 start_codon:yes stop_codon:yes gene_type:complete